MCVSIRERALRSGGGPRWIGRAAGAGLVVLALAACADGDPTAITDRDAFPPAEVVSGTMAHTGRLTLEDETVQEFALPSHSFAVPLDGRGIARSRPRASAISLEEAVAGLTPVVGVEARGRSVPEHRTLSFVDPAGQRHELQLLSAGGRVLRVEHRLNGELFARLERSWSQQGGTLRLRNATAMAQHGGRRVDIASNLSNATATGNVAFPVTTGAQSEFGYYFVEEDNALTCFGATMNLFAASGALASAIATGNPLAITIAFAYYIAAVDQYKEECG